MENEAVGRREALAKDILILSRNTLLVNLRFLDLALSRFALVPVPPLNPLLLESIAVDGAHIFYSPTWVLLRYRGEQNAVVRDYLHMVFHCVFHHAFVDTLIDRELWDLACDIAAENAIRDLALPCTACARETEQTPYITELAAKLKFLTAEKIYHCLRETPLSPQKRAEMRRCFAADDHALWYLPPEQKTGAARQLVRQNGGQGSGEGGKPGDGQGSGEDGNPADGQGGAPGDTQGGAQNGGQQDASGAAMSGGSLADQWKDIAQRMQTDLETFSARQRGTGAGSLTQNLQAVTREKYDYTDFLRRFAVLGEAMKVNDDEFDYIFYTYGLKLYGNMPLIEPLEYKEVRRIREFVIAIDTSGSVSGALVQKFLQKTYNILKAQESFFTRINLHIIQCDAEIQEDHKVTSQEEFDEYLRTMQLRGFGGTDFRPEFDYVEQLRKAVTAFSPRGCRITTRRSFSLTTITAARPSPSGRSSSCCRATRFEKQKKQNRKGPCHEFERGFCH